MKQDMDLLSSRGIQARDTVNGRPRCGEDHVGTWQKRIRNERHTNQPAAKIEPLDAYIALQLLAKFKKLLTSLEMKAVGPQWVDDGDEVPFIVQPVGVVEKHTDAAR